MQSLKQAFSGSPSTPAFHAAGVFCILLLLPVVHWEGVNLVASIPKAVFFSAAILLLGVSIAGTALRQTHLPVPGKRVLWALLAFMLSSVLSTLLSTDTAESLWGGYARGLGMIDLLTLLLFGWCVFVLFPAERVRSACWSLASSGSLAVLMGLAYMASGTTDLRVAIGTPLGHPNFLGQLLTLTLPVSVTLLCTEHRYRRLLAALLIVIQCTGLAMTGSRAALLGVLMAGLILLGYSTRSAAKIRIGLAGILGSILLLVFIANVLPPHTLSRSFPLLQRLNFSEAVIGHETSTQSLTVRTHLWQMALAGIEERPFIGHGGGAVSSILARHFHPQLLALERYNAIPDRVHSDPLERLLAYGLLGFVTWMVLAFFILRTGFVAFFATCDLRMLGLTAALISHGIALLFSFPTIVDLALVAAIAALILRSGGPIQRMRPTFWLPVFLFLLFVTGFAFADDLQILRADRAFRSWEQSPHRNEALKNLEYADAHSPRHSYTAYLATEYLALERDADALHLLDTSLTSTGPDAQLLALRAQAHVRLGNRARAEQDFLQASSLAPYSPHVWRTWGIALAETGDAVNAVKTLEHLLSFSPVYWQWDGTVDEKGDADRSRYDAFFKQNPDFRDIFLFLGRARFQAGDVQGALDALTHAVQDVATLSTYGVIYAAQGNIPEARLAFERALTLEPGNEMLLYNLQKLSEKTE